MSKELPDGVHTVQLAVPDAAGVLRGKLIPASAWPAVAEGGIHMASVLYSWTPRCEIREDDEWADPSKGWPDMHVTPLDDLRLVPWRPGFALTLCETSDDEGNELPVSPRSALKRVLAHAERLGFEVRIGFEIEFYLLDAVSKKPRHDNIQCYGLARAAEYEDALGPMRNDLIAFGIPIEAANAEYAPGQVEINVRYDEAMHTADNAVLFRNAVKEIATQHGYVASFMAKISRDQSGSGVHLHHSLWRDGANVFADGRQLSDIGRWYLGGLQRHMADFTLFGSPTPNSYKRRQAYSFCPQTASWGHDNRTVGLRVIEGSESAVRIEQRDGSSDANPYLIMAAQIAAGIDGVEHQIEPGPPTDADAYADEAGAVLPRTVPEAAEALEKSDLAREVFGDTLIRVVVGTARHEHAYVNERVSDVERDRYLEAF
ncbi:glutamine synthetase family protein [Nocardioides terrisoli]|uniref:glutamine synthetase family protein n=1 Tax=Nocardioides terrisoli TaxID=3388267 RepID=UPI00287B9F5A|nr:glutamine synthetase family protein [Nocardioides marmorisolisilvae]